MRAYETPRDDVVSAPLQCPFCRSNRVLTTSKLVTDATYWRCQACGQIWNPARLVMTRLRPE
jgi:transposase-like protein